MSLVLSKGGNEMGVRYDRLFKLLDDKNMSTRELEKQANFSGNITTRMRSIPVMLSCRRPSQTAALIAIRIKVS